MEAFVSATRALAATLVPAEPGAPAGPA
jgi:hypothetical protein